MGYFKAGKQTKKGDYPMQEPKEKVEDILTYPFRESKERGVSKETCERFGIRAGISETDGTTVTAYYFPSYNQKGKIVGYMRQDVTKSKDEKNHWTAIGSVTIGNKLFGQEVAESINRKRSNLIITEGQWDAVSVYQALVDNVSGTKYEGLEPQVVSIPLGTANAVEAILHNEEYVKSHTALTIFFDDDHCTPKELKAGVKKGYEAREAVASALVGSGISLMTVTASDGFKDASDYLQAGQSETLAKLVQFGKRPYSAEKIVKANSVTFEQLISKREQGVVVDCFPELMKKLNGFRRNELTMLLAPSNVGKSTVCSILAHKFMQAGHKIGMIYLEEDTKDTLQRMVAAQLKVNFVQFRRDPLSVASEKDIQEAYDFIAGQDRLVMLDHFGSIPISDLMNKIKHLHLVEGCNYIVLDHISAVISGLQSDNERKDLDVVMTELAAFCSANPVHILVVSHINRTDSQQFLPPKGKEGESFWVNVRKESARGSAALEQFSWNILGLEPEINPDFSRGRVRLKVLKTRFGDSLGIADVFTLDHDTWDVILDVSENCSF
jgi:archaellum biogenesis ATPase FlaH